MGPNKYCALLAPWAVITFSDSFFLYLPDTVKSFPTGLSAHVFSVLTRRFVEKERSNAVLSTALLVHFTGRHMVLVGGNCLLSRRPLRFLRLDCLLPHRFSSRHSPTGSFSFSLSNLSILRTMYQVLEISL